MKPYERRTVGWMLGRIASPAEWDRLPDWPPDVFACTAVLLHVTGAFRFVVSPPSGSRWPPDAAWAEQVDRTAAEWRERSTSDGGELPALVSSLWADLSRALDSPLEDLASGAAWQACAAILSLHAIADEAMSRLDDPATSSADGLERRAWQLVETTGSLSRLPPSGIRILPKTHLAQGGINLRSLSRHLSSHVSPVEVTWSRVPLGDVEERNRTGTTWNLLLLPWPLEVVDSDFRACEGPLDSMDPGAFGFFTYEPSAPLDLGYVESSINQAVTSRGRVDGIVLPEGAILPDEIPALERIAVEHGVVFVATGVRVPATEAGFGRNYASIGIWDGHDWSRLEADKHHRWGLDASQIEQYGLSNALEPDRLWWEAISIPRRSIPFLDVGGGATASVLICEDLARLDEVAEVVRFVGPSLVIALLLDGPQLAARWSARYATVLADDPGSAVLTLTALGMASRSRHRDRSGSRVIALWKDCERGLKEIDLAPGAGSVLLKVGERRKTVWTADGRCHRDVTPLLVLEDLAQIPAPVGTGSPVTPSLDASTRVQTRPVGR